jgi:serine protease Do
VPSNLARKVFGELQKYGEVRRGSIGYVEITPLTTQLAEQLGAPNTSGVVITSFARNSSAARAGLRPGDVIVSFNGKPVTEGSELSRAIQDSSIGSTATFGVIRDGRRTDIKVPITQ